MERQGRKVRILSCRKIHVFFSNYYLEEDLKSCTLSGKQISGETWASEKLSIGLSALGPPGCLPACQMLETWSLSCAGGRSVYAESKQICPGDFFFPLPFSKLTNSNRKYFHCHISVWLLTLIFVSWKKKCMVCGFLLLSFCVFFMSHHSLFWATEEDCYMEVKFGNKGIYVVIYITLTHTPYT